MKTKTKLTAETMTEIEKRIASLIQDGIDLYAAPEDVCDMLHLQHTTDALPPSVHAVLMAPDDDTCMGRIKVNKSLSSYDMRYALTWGIACYLTVCPELGKVQGRRSYIPTETVELPEMCRASYMARAMMIPWSHIIKDLNEAGMSCRDDLSYFGECGRRYGEDIPRLVKSRYWERLREVTKMLRHEEFVKTFRLKRIKGNFFSELIRRFFDLLIRKQT